MLKSMDHGLSFTSKNPATGAVVWEGHAASEADVDAAVQAAIEAFDSWSRLSLQERFLYLSDFCKLLEEAKHSFAESISIETGKPLWDSQSEVAAMIRKAAICLDAYGKRCAELERTLPHALSMTRHRPYGVVAVLGPYNFPGHLPNGHIMPALLAGNTVVFKPSELTPHVAEEMCILWQKAALPKGVLNLVQGGRETGQLLLHHPAIKGLFFTGSYQTGQALLNLLGPQADKILALEMGGNNPLVVGTIADLPAAAHVIIQSAYISSGQRCTCARRLIVPDSSLGERLLQVLITMMSSITVGPYTLSPEPFMGPVISEKQAQNLLNAQENLRSKGGKSLVEMRLQKPGTPFLTPGLMDVTAIAKRPDDEIFGPFLQVIRTPNLQTAIEEANRTKYGLSAGLLSQDPEEYAQFCRQIEAGVVNWNAPLTGASSWAPFGGIKCSGNHRPSAYYAADYCAYPVASIESPVLKMPDQRLPGLITGKSS